MGDIDFDELDKAVNSLMSSADAPSRDNNTGMDPANNADQKSTSPSDTPPLSPTTRQMPRQLTPASKPSLNTSASQRASSPLPATPAVRRSGRFMDVVDSTSELNPLKRPVTERAAAKSSQPRPVIKPLNEMTVPDSPVSPEPAAVATEPSKENSADTLGDSVPVRLVAKDSSMPDPLDVLQPTPVEVPEVQKEDDEPRPVGVFNADATGISLPSTDELPKEETASLPPENDLSDLSRAIQEQLNQVNPATDAAVSDKEHEVIAPTTVQVSPVDNSVEQAEENNNSDTTDIPNSEETVATGNESPFLADAKPDKRPLNANPTSPQVSTDFASTETPLDSAGKQEYNLEDALPPAQELDGPEEFGTPPELSSELVAIEATGKPVEESQPDSSVAPEMKQPVSDVHAAATADTDKVVGPTSITQQYQPTESTGDTSHAPIYDATQYPDPVKHPAKKKSGWWMVLSVMLLLALGSGGAVALYFMGIIP